MKIDPEAWYTPDSPEMERLGKPQTLANWRCQGIGPKYTKFGHRVLYRGVNILVFLNANEVETQAA